MSTFFVSHRRPTDATSHYTDVGTTSSNSCLNFCNIIFIPSGQYFLKCPVGCVKERCIYMQYFEAIAKYMFYPYLDRPDDGERQQGDAQRSRGTIPMSLWSSLLRLVVSGCELHESGDEHLKQTTHVTFSSRIDAFFATASSQPAIDMSAVVLAWSALNINSQIIPRPEKTGFTCGWTGSRHAFFTRLPHVLNVFCPSP